MPTWPDTLPCFPLSNTLAVQIEPNVVEFRPDVGEPMKRRRYLGTRHMLSATLMLSRGQVAALHTFFNDDCGAGTIPFTMRDWESAMATGSNETLEYTFDAPPELRHVGPGKFSATIALSTST